MINLLSIHKQLNQHKKQMQMQEIIFYNFRLRMNSSSLQRMRFYLTKLNKFNLTHLQNPGMNNNQLAKVLEDNFPWPPDMLFTSANVISISLYSAQLVVGLTANCYSLVYLLRERLVLHNKNMILLLIHLTCADLCVSSSNI